MGEIVVGEDVVSTIRASVKLGLFNKAASPTSCSGMKGVSSFDAVDVDVLSLPMMMAMSGSTGPEGTSAASSALTAASSLSSFLVVTPTEMATMANRAAVPAMNQPKLPLR